MGRTTLQRWGTDIIRAKDANFWVNVIMNLISVLEDEFDYFILTDCRFPNEILEFQKKYNFTNNKNVAVSVRIERPDYKSELTLEQQQHPSETGLDNFEFDYYFQNVGSLEDLEVETEKLICWLEVENNG